MKKKLSLLVVLAFTANTYAQTNLKQTFMKLETEWMNSWKSKDKKTANDILDDKFHLISSLTKGELIDKKGYLTLLMERPLKSFSIDSINVTSDGTVAIVYMWITQTAKANGNDWSGKLLISDVWLSKNNVWKAVCRHSSWLNKNS